MEINGETPTMRLFSLLELIASRDQLFSLQALVDDAQWALREPAARPDDETQRHAHELGRELFAGLRRNVLSAEEGAITWM